VEGYSVDKAHQDFRRARRRWFAPSPHDGRGKPEILARSDALTLSVGARLGESGMGSGGGGPSSMRWVAASCVAQEDDLQFAVLTHGEVSKCRSN
jgi:hypothetical protein